MYKPLYMNNAASPLWVITTYFNWCHYQSKLANYYAFRDSLVESNIPLLTVECALYGERFDMAASKRTVQVRTGSILWQKERLLNIALEALPASCRFVAWIDCDLLFENRVWHETTIKILEQYGITQLFQDMVRLPQYGTMADPVTKAYPSFMGALTDSIRKKLPARLGHPGFAWAARRDVLDACNGFFDTCIIGGADRVMAHAWFGDFESPSVTLIATGNIAPHYRKWAETAHRVVRGSVSCVPGRLFHLWHGDSADRLYYDRHKPIAELGFDPSLDLEVNQDGCWEWSNRKPEIDVWMRNYFANRREDG